VAVVDDISRVIQRF